MVKVYHLQREIPRDILISADAEFISMTLTSDQELGPVD
jgi:hypothetical protein